MNSVRPALGSPFLPAAVFFAAVFFTARPAEGGLRPVQAPPILKDSYVGREADAPWRREAAERIERHRKGDLVVRVTDAAGTPLVGVEVSVRMRRHAFPFGTQVDKNLLTDPSSTGEEYRRRFLELFNYATVNSSISHNGRHPPGPRRRATRP